MNREPQANPPKADPAPHPLMYSSSDPSRMDPLNLVTLCRMRVIEADLAQAKLQSEGIECIVRDSRFAVAEPLLLTDVPILVRDSDVERAREILARPAPASAEGEYVEEAWRCPSCHRRAVDLLPLSPGWRIIRASCVILLVLPILLSLIKLAVGTPEFRARIEDIVEWGALPWFIVVAGLSVTLLLIKRRKRCRDCGHEWIDGRPAVPDQPVL